MRLHSKGFIFHLDEVRYSDFPAREYMVCGWCASPELESVTELWLEAEGRRTPCLVGLPRPDVAMHFAQPPLAEAGFAGKIAVSGPDTRLDFFAANAAAAEPILTLHRPVRFDNNDPRPNEYRDAWLPQNEPNLFWTEAEIPEKLASFRQKPVISVILPTFNTDLYHLHRCVMSVAGQKYPNWELCISDDGSTDSRTLAALAELAGRDRRISVQLCARNGGISESSNRALERAGGEFVVLLDHDDELHPYALLEIVRELNLHPDADLLYSDEDKIDQTGNRSEPAFKPAFDEDILLAFCYIGHLVCMRRSLVLKAGGFRTQTDGAQDWDLLLRVTELTHANRVRHIAKPLYHWRLHENSTSQSLDAKPWAQVAWHQVLGSCLQRRGIAATVTDGLFLGSMRVKREAGAGGLAVVTVLENGDQRHVFSRVRLPPETRFYELSVAGLHRLPAGQTEPDYPAPLLTLDELEGGVTVFVNCPLDSLSHGALQELAAQCGRDDCGLVSGALVDRDGQVLNGSACTPDGSFALNPAGGEHLRSLGYMGLFKVVRCVPWVFPAFFAAPTRLLKEVGGLSAISAVSLDDLCGRLARLCHQRGLKIIFTPYAVAVAQRFTSKANVALALDIPLALRLNPNLASMPNTVQVLRAGL